MRDIRGVLNSRLQLEVCGAAIPSLSLTHEANTQAFCRDQSTQGCTQPLCDSVRRTMESVNSLVGTAAQVLSLTKSTYQNTATAKKTIDPNPLP
jgi:hypothetical protein